MTEKIDRPIIRPRNTSQRNAAEQYQLQSRRLGQLTSEQEDSSTGITQAVVANFITAQDPVIETANGGRLPAVPLEEAVKLNVLKDKAEGKKFRLHKEIKTAIRESRDGTVHGIDPSSIPAIKRLQSQSSMPQARLGEAIPQTRTNPLFPPVPIWGPPTAMRNLQCLFFRATSAVLSLCFLLVIVLGAMFSDIAPFFQRLWWKVTNQDPDLRRPFYEDEIRNAKRREDEEVAWLRSRERRRRGSNTSDEEMEGGIDDEFVPTEGGPDKLICDVAYYARRVGLDCETFLVQTEDGFIIELWHIFNPRDTKPTPKSRREAGSPDVFPSDLPPSSAEQKWSGEKPDPAAQRKYPVLLIHGLLQSAGAYCSNDDSSLAFYLAKSGYDVWLGNNRCGFRPRHTLLEYRDPRMWAWNIRQMGVMDLPALISRVLSETGFPKLALVAHSQGTTQTLVALAKEQRPDIGEKLSVFCALAPAAYAGPLIGKAYFKFMHLIPPAAFRLVFGIHAFIPFMMTMHASLPMKLYGYMGYRIFSFLFNWTDTRWDRGLRDRCFIFAPVYVSAESMRWWLGRECFARQKCILSTREEGILEDEEDEEIKHDQHNLEHEHDEKDEEKIKEYYERQEEHLEAQRGSGETDKDIDRKDSFTTSIPSSDSQSLSPPKPVNSPSSSTSSLPTSSLSPEQLSRYAWYSPQFPPLAMWIAGSDDLVDGQRLLRRFQHGREPHVDVVHAKVIPGYEHLDVIWAMDSIEQVGREVREVIWKTVDEKGRGGVRVPKGCEEVGVWKSNRSGEGMNVVDGNGQ